MDEYVTFKGSKNGLHIILNEKATFEEIVSRLEKKLNSAKNFFKGCSVTIQHGNRVLDEDQRLLLEDILINRNGITDVTFTADSSFITNDDTSSTVQYQPTAQGFNAIAEGASKFYRQTVRNGQKISFDGHVIIIGDVNPGGEISASGNIIVIGALRGIAHAGAKGDRNAVVVAFSLQPTQLRISDIIARSPDGDNTKPDWPEIAYIKDNALVIEPCVFPRADNVIKI
ncbi:MAG TPA: septum site-determining protein MinC [Clostridiales bacterium]|nr:septum site-determining protein MinC [Clostridiales bacterium]